MSPKQFESKNTEKKNMIKMYIVKKLQMRW